MKNKNLKILYLISAVSIISISILLIFSSCADKSDDGREVFSPTSGEYEIMLIPGEWTAVTDFAQNSNNLNLIHEASGTLFNVNCYTKTNASQAGISDLNGFIEYFKTLETGNNPYKSGTEITAGDLTDINKRDFKGSVVTAGKNQKISANYAVSGSENTISVITDIIYLESKNHYFAVYYTAKPDAPVSSTDATGANDLLQAGANDLISHIKKEQ